MNKLTRPVSSMLALIVLTGMISGCALFANWQTTAGKTLASIALTTDAAMKGWAKWVADGHATPGDEATVKAAYEKYQTALRIAKTAYSDAVTVNDSAGWDRALTFLQSTSGDVQKLVTQFQNK